MIYKILISVCKEDFYLLGPLGCNPSNLRIGQMKKSFLLKRTLQPFKLHPRL